MAEEKSRYQQLEQVLTVFIVLDLLFFLGYLLAALFTVLWAKVLLLVLTLLASALGIALLFSTREIKRHRSRWITYALICIPLCMVVSMICQFP